MCNVYKCRNLSWPFLGFYQSFLGFSKQFFGLLLLELKARNLLFKFHGIIYIGHKLIGLQWLYFLAQNLYLNKQKMVQKNSQWSCDLKGRQTPFPQLSIQPSPYLPKLTPPPVKGVRPPLPPVYLHHMNAMSVHIFDRKEDPLDFSTEFWPFFVILF